MGWKFGLAQMLLACLLTISPAPGAENQVKKVVLKSRNPLLQGLVSTVQSGDLDDMVKRRLVKILVVHNRTDYFLDRGKPFGMAFESARAFKEMLNRRYAKRRLPIRVQVIPVGRDEVVPLLAAGKADFAMAPTKVIPENTSRVDFSDPVKGDIDELLVSQEGLPPLSDITSLSGQTVFVRRSSAYHMSLDLLNQRLAAEGRELIHIRDAPEYLNDGDILELVDAGVVDYTVVDSFKAPLFTQAFPKIRVDLAHPLREGLQIAFALRRGTPKLKGFVDKFLDTHGVGTTFGNTLVKRYYTANRWIKNSLSHPERVRYDRLIHLFQKYGKQYDLDHLLVAAQGFQESGLDQSRRSRAGAIGIMQVLPSTGKSLRVGDIRQVEPNIHAGCKYLRTLMDNYLTEPGIDPMNRALLAFAAYNAGPGNLHRIRVLAAKRGLDPNRWFNQVELVASEKLGLETLNYVANISNYYLGYTLLEEQRQRQGVLDRHDRPKAEGQ